MATKLSWNDWVNLQRGVFNAQQTDAGRGDAPVGPRYDESGNLVRPMDDLGNFLPFNPYSADSYAGGIYDPVVHLQNSGLWDMGYRPGMDMPWREDNGSLLSGVMDIATPIASTAGLGLGIGAGLGALTGGVIGLAPGAIGSQLASIGANVAPEVGALYSGLDAATLAGTDLAGAGAMGASGYTAATAPAGLDAASFESMFGPRTFDVAANPLNVISAPPTGVAAIDAPGMVRNLSGAGMVPGIEAGGALYSANAPVSGAGTPPPPTTGGDEFWKKLISSPQAIGMLGGAALGGLSTLGAPDSQTTTQTEDLPDWLKPYLRPALDKYSTEVQNFNVDPYGVMPAAMQEYKNTLSGMYLDPATNQYLEKFFNAGAERVKSNLSPSFGHMQAFGSHSGYNEALSRGLSDLSLGLYGGAYEKERDRMSQMTAAAPNFLGTASQAKFSPYSTYLQTIGSLGKTRTQTQDLYNNPFASIIGGGMMGYGLGNIFK